MIVSCASCQSKFKIDPAKVPAAGTRLRCPKCKGVIAVGPVSPSEPVASAPAPASAPGPRLGASQPAAPVPAGPRPGASRPEVPVPAAPLVVVAHGNAAFCDTLAGFLKRNRFGCETATDGEAALALVTERRPAVLLVDVALPGIVGYKLCEQIKGDPAVAGTRVVLIGAIYDRSRYRRPPASLYGSDGYIEKHEIPDKLVPLLNQLVSGEAPAASPSALPAAPSPSPARPEPGGPHSSPPAGKSATAASASGSDQARRLARIIVSDIVLYNPDVVKRGIAEGNLPDLLKDELKEGRDLLKTRVGADAEASDYVLEALGDYVRLMSARGAAAAQR